MYPVQEVPPPANSSSSSQRQSKVITQRQYREKEGECFHALRYIIKQLTGEELVTRYEILRKAIDLLSSTLETGRQDQSQVVPAVQPEMPELNPADTSFAHSAYYPEAYWPQSSESGYYPAGLHTGDQQYYPMAMYNAHTSL